MLASPTTGLVESNENLIFTAMQLQVENVSQLNTVYFIRGNNIIMATERGYLSQNLFNSRI